MSSGFISAKPCSRHHRKNQRSKQSRQVSDSWDTRHQLWYGDPDNSAWFKAPERPADDKVWDMQGRVDRLHDMIPFWRKNVYAAEHGEDMEKLEDFLEQLQTKEAQKWSWGAPEDDAAWSAHNAGEWGVASKRGCKVVEDGGWGAVDESGWAVKDEEDVGWAAKDWEMSYDPWEVGKSKQNAWPNASEDAVDRHSDQTPRASDPESSDRPASETSDDKEASSFVRQVAQREHASPSRKRNMQQFYLMPTQQKVKKIEEVVEFLRRNP